jgi:predicted dienelactone hydrolase
VILSPGFGIGSTSYAWLAEHLASYGFVVISPDHRETLDPQDQLWRSAITRPQELQSVIAFLDRETSPGGIFEGLIDTEQTAVIGHSYGGYTALAAGGARIDTDSFGDTCQSVTNTDLPGAWLCQQLIPHIQEMSDLAGLNAVPAGLWPDWGIAGIDALVPVASDALFFGQPGLSQITIPVLAIGGTADQDAPFKWGTGPSYEFSSGARKAQLSLLAGEHMIFTGPCESIRWYLRPLAGEFCSDPGWERSYAHQITRHFTTAFLLTELKGDQDAIRCLSPEMVDFPQIEFNSQGY